MNIPKKNYIRIALKVLFKLDFSRVTPIIRRIMVDGKPRVLASCEAVLFAPGAVQDIALMNSRVAGGCSGLISTRGQTGALGHAGRRWRATPAGCASRLVRRASVSKPRCCGWWAHCAHRMAMRFSSASICPPRL